MRLNAEVIDKSVPEIYHETIKKGVLAWNEAMPDYPVAGSLLFGATKATNPIRGRGDLRPSWFGWVSQRWAALGIPYDFTVRSVGLGASSIPPLD